MYFAMRTPIRSEKEAFRFAIASAAVIGVAVLVGWLTEPVVGVAAFGVAVLVALIAYLRAPNPDRRPVLSEAADAPHPHGASAGKRHVLVVANETLQGGELRERILAGDRERVEVDVLAPVLTSHAHLATTDVDHERAQASVRLERSLQWITEMGITARGEVGNTSPTSAIEDELRDYGADEVIVVTHQRRRETWQERGELERLRRELNVPVTHIVVGDGADEAKG